MSYTNSRVVLVEDYKACIRLKASLHSITLYIDRVEI